MTAEGSHLECVMNIFHSLLIKRLCSWRMSILSESLGLNHTYIWVYVCTHIQLFWELQCSKRKVEKYPYNFQFLIHQYYKEFKSKILTEKYEIQTKTESKGVKQVLDSKLLLNCSIKLEDLRLNELTAHHQRHFPNRFFFSNPGNFPFPPSHFFLLPSFLLLIKSKGTDTEFSNSKV